jgi:hypothetical protein
LLGAATDGRHTAAPRARALAFAVSHPESGAAAGGPRPPPRPRIATRVAHTGAVPAVRRAPAKRVARSGEPGEPGEPGRRRARRDHQLGVGPLETDGLSSRQTKAPSTTPFSSKAKRLPLERERLFAKQIRALCNVPVGGRALSGSNQRPLWLEPPDG